MQEFADDWDDAPSDDRNSPDPELGMLKINLGKEQQETRGYCSLTMTRLQGGVATLNGNLTVQAFDQQAGADSEFGELNFNWGADNQANINPMGISYEPPMSSDNNAGELGWVHDMEDANSATLEIKVDDQPYDFANGDLGGTDKPEDAPHLWQTKFSVSASLVKPSDAGQAMRAQGQFEYEGLCTVSIQMLE